MDTRIVATLAMRLFALFVALQGLQELFGGLSFAVAAPLNTFSVTRLIFGFVILGLGGLIWGQSDRLAERALGQRADSNGTLVKSEGTQRLTPSTILALALALLGIYFVVRGLVSGALAFAFWAIADAAAQFRASSGLDPASQAKAQAITSAAYLVTGAVLILVRRGLSGRLEASLPPSVSHE